VVRRFRDSFSSSSSSRSGSLSEIVVIGTTVIRPERTRNTETTRWSATGASPGGRCGCQPRRDAACAPAFWSVATGRRFLSTRLVAGLPDRRLVKGAGSGAGVDWPTSRLGRKSGDRSPHSRTLPRRLGTSRDGLTDHLGMRWSATDRSFGRDGVLTIDTSVRPQTGGPVPPRDPAPPRVSSGAVGRAVSGRPGNASSGFRRVWSWGHNSSPGSGGTVFTFHCRPVRQLQTASQSGL